VSSDLAFKCLDWAEVFDSKTLQLKQALHALPFILFFVKTCDTWFIIYDNEITSLIDIYFLRISFIPSDPFCYFIYVTYSTDK
jgi:hypothetical protein